jgi:hypothetical protein
MSKDARSQAGRTRPTVCAGQALLCYALLPPLGATDRRKPVILPRLIVFAFSGLPTFLRASP